MKKIYLPLLFAISCSLVSNAQLIFQKGNISHVYSPRTPGEVTFDGSTNVLAGGHTYNLREIDRMYTGRVLDKATTGNVMEIEFRETGAMVFVDGLYADDIDLTVDGNHVTVTYTAADDSYFGCILTGETNNGSLTLQTDCKNRILLDNVTLTNPAGPAINIPGAIHTDIITRSSSANRLTDGAGGSHKGCIATKGSLGFGSESQILKATLDIAGNTSHAVSASRYVTVSGGTLNISSAVKDGINCNQYFEATKGTVSITGVGDDCIQVSFKDDTDRDDIDTGSITIGQCDLTLSTAATAAKCLKADGDITISGGSVNATVTGGGKWDATKSKTKAAACISADGNFNMTAGTLALRAEGSGGKGISVDGNLAISGGNVSVETLGGMYAYVNGTEYNNYTGNTDRLDSDSKSSPKGIKADGDITINGGEINVSTKGNGGEGIESKAELTINDGTIKIQSYDDAVNSSSHMHINGGTVVVIASGNDGLDSNGNMYINGGTIYAFGTSSPECGIDANEEEGYSVIFTGGTLLAYGGGNSVPRNAESTQPYITTSTTVKGLTHITVSDGSTQIADFDVPYYYEGLGNNGGMRPAPGGGPGVRPGENGGGSLLISCPGLTSGSQYTIKVDETSSTATARLTGTSGGGGRPF